MFGFNFFFLISRSTFGIVDNFVKKLTSVFVNFGSLTRLEVLQAFDLVVQISSSREKNKGTVVIEDLIIKKMSVKDPRLWTMIVSEVDMSMHRGENQVVLQLHHCSTPT